MNAEHIEDDKLQQYFDGELPGRHVALVERHLSDCERCTSRHASLGRLSRMIGIAAEDLAVDLHTENLFHRIEQGMQQKQAPGWLERIRVRWAEFLEHESQVWLPLGGAVAVTAAVLLTWALPRGGDAPSRVDEPVAAVEAPPSTIPPEPPANTEVTEADFGDNAGTVFEIALAKGVSTQVVWINDEDFD